MYRNFSTEREAREFFNDCRKAGMRDGLKLCIKARGGRLEYTVKTRTLRRGAR